MMRLVYITILSSLIVSCGSNPTCDFRFGRLDTLAVQKVIRKSVVKDKDTISGKTYYWSKADGIYTKILRNKTGQIIAIVQNRNHVKLFVCEYYPNGQQMGDVPLTRDGKITGEATFYYATGKLRCTGRLRDGISVGEWKYYDGDGNLVKKETP
jgi:antitoxin component YwqK of YwqJK toxin-antitoxin module